MQLSVRSNSKFLDTANVLFDLTSEPSFYSFLETLSQYLVRFKLILFVDFVVPSELQASEEILDRRCNLLDTSAVRVACCVLKSSNSPY